MRVVVAGGAGFLGSHLCDALLGRGDEVVCLDNFVTGNALNVAHLVGRSDFVLVEQDVTHPLAELDGPIDAVMNLASPASPKDYLASADRDARRGQHRHPSALGARPPARCAVLHGVDE